MTKTTKPPLCGVLGFDLDDKIEVAMRYGQLYTPSSDEWHRARPYQRDSMTWPADVLRMIRWGS